jgi:mannose-6-phosphate isomerase-like protein (cupin superfamily)
MTNTQEAQIFNIKDAPSHTMQLDRGTQFRLFGALTGAKNIDVHINVINLDSGPGPYHYHERAENVYVVLEGKVEVCVEGKRYYLYKDDVGFIPPGLRHYAGTAPDSDVPARVLEVYAPVGKDYHIVDDPTEIEDVAR